MSAKPETDKPWVHKLSSRIHWSDDKLWTVCSNLFSWDLTTGDWSEVTCPECLKRAPKSDLAQT